MSRKVIAGVLSFLLASTLALPGAAAQQDNVQGTYGDSKIISRLDNQALTSNPLNVRENINLQGRDPDRLKDSQNRSESNGLTFEKQDSPQPTVVEPQSFVPASDSTEPISVIVELQEEPVKVFEATRSNQRSILSTESHKSNVRLEQQTFKSQALSELNAQFHREYSGIFNGYSLTVAANQVDDLLNLPGVKAVYPNNTVFATVDSGSGDSATLPSSAEFIGSSELWDKGVEGSGIKVGVIDTGIAKDHPDLQAVIAAGDWGYDFVNDDPEPYETTKEDYEQAKAQDPTLPETDEDGRPYWTSHGTHVSGVIAGQNKGTAGKAGVQGIAPKAELHAYKVLGPYGSGSTDDVIAGIEKAVEDKMDVINLSLGSTGNNENSAESIALNNAVMAGVIAVVSAGNSGPDAATIGDPGTSEMAITVGASKSPQVTPKVTISPMENGNFFMDPFDTSVDLDTLDGSYELVDAGLGKAADFEGKDFSGKVAFIKRGEIAFSEKAQNAQNAGAVAAIVYNNSPEALESGTLGGVNITIPVYALSGLDGDKVKAAMDQEPQQVQFSKTTESDIMASFSSRGPAKPSFKVKPDISAPGMNIVSSVPEYEGWYESESGTSMAAPHIAGAAALLREYYPELSPDEIKVLMMNNAVNLSDRSGNRYSYMDQGAGRVDLQQVMDAKAIAMVDESTESVENHAPTPFHTGSLSLGYVLSGSSTKRTVEVKDISNTSTSYSITTDWYGDSPGEVVLSKDTASVSPGEQDSFDVTINVSDNARDQQLYEGRLTLTDGSGDVITIPMSLYVGEAPQVDVVTDLTVDPSIFSPNGDNVADTTDITFNINAYTDYFSLDVFSADGSWLGTLHEVTDGTEPESYILRGWDGTLDGEPLPDNAYLLVPFIGSSMEDSAPLADQLTNFIIDTQAPAAQLDDPEIQVDTTSSSGTISGRVTQDLLIDWLVGEGGLSISDVIGVAAGYEDNGEFKQVDGTIDEEGHFTIDVPVVPGDNAYEIYVYDEVGNGMINPLKVVNYYLQGVSTSVHPSKPAPNKAFTVDIDFSVTDAVYSTKFDLLYSKQLGEAEVLPSPQLTDHQEQNNPDEPLTVTDTVYDENDLLKRLEFFESLKNTDGYTGKGTLASFEFAGVPAGQYDFEIKNLVLLDREGNEIQVNVTPTFQVSVQEPASLRVEPQSVSVKKGSSQQLKVFYKGPDGVEADVAEQATYTVRDSQVAQVNKGLVTGKSVGQTSVQVRYEGLTQDIPVTITSSGGGDNGGGNGGGGNGGSNNGGASTPPPTTPAAPQAPAGSVKEPIQAQSPAAISLKDGLTLKLPAGANLPANAAYAQITPASEKDTQQLTDSLKLDSTFTPLGVYYDFSVLDAGGSAVNGLSSAEPIEISIPLEALHAANLNGETINLYEISPDGKVTQHIGRLKDGKILAEVTGTGRYLFMAKNVSFTDVSEQNYSWAANAIEVLASKDIVTGTEANIFTPAKEVTRAEFVALLIRSLGLNVEAGAGQSSFTDVQAGSWYEDAIQTAVSKGIVSGYADHSFAPDQTITRAEMAIILSRALTASGYTEEAGSQFSSYSDQADLPNWSKDAIAQVSGAGLMQGGANNRFNGDASATRAEAAVVVYRLFKDFTK